MTAKSTIIVGIIVAVASALLALFLPDISGWISEHSRQPGVDRPLLQIASVVAQILNRLLAPLGAVLIGAGIVMAHIDRVLPTRATVHAIDLDGD